MPIRRSCVRWPLAVALFILLVVMLAPVAVAGDGGAVVTTAEARAEASRLMSKVNRETSRNPRSGSAEPGWTDASTGEPLLIYSFDGEPRSYLVPVLDDDGKAESVITVDAATGEWCSYGDVSQGKFPLVDASEAAAAARTFLSERGVASALPAPQARTAPDKNVYWFFELGGKLAVDEVYLPVFLAESPSTNLETPPWEKKRTGTSPARSATGGSVAASGSSAAPAVYPGGAPAAYDIPDVPHHYQEVSYWCGPASLEMLFDYWGADISQREIADVVDADYYGSAYNTDLVRAGHFSSQSVAIADPSLRGYNARSTGYGSADVYWNYSGLYATRYSDLKELVSKNYPVLILTYYNTPPSSGHFRVVKGYDDNLGTFIVHDPWYTPPYEGPNVNFNQSFLVDTLWPYSNRWGMIAAPWNVAVSMPSAVSAGQVFNVTANVSYRGPSPFEGQYPANNPTATFQSDGNYQLLTGAVNQPISGIGASGSSGSSSWTVKALSNQSTSNIRIVAQGLIDGGSYSYSSYSDWIGGASTGPAGSVATSRTWGHDSAGVSAAAETWYLAEGSTNGGFETWVLVQNPGDDDARVELTYMTPSGPVTGPEATVAGNSRKTFFVADNVPNQWSVSTKVTSDTPVIAERAMYGPGRQWGHDSVAVPSASDTWYLAEGSTAGGFETWVVVQNPNGSAANVTLTYMTPAGPVNGPTVSVAANSRRTFFVADTVPNEWSVSTKVTSTRPVIAERAMYGGGRTWGHDSAGVTAAAGAWYLAEGCTNGGFETWVVVQNPNNSAAIVNLTYMTTEGEVAGPSFSLGANSRRTVNVAEMVPNNWEVSTKVAANKPVIAERAMYGGGRTWGHDSAGVSSPASDWYLAEGCTQTGFETWVLVQNPNDYSVDVELTYMTPAGEVAGPTAALEANSRMTFNVADTLPYEWEVSTRVQSTGGDVIAERSMYGDPK